MDVLERVYNVLTEKVTGKFVHLGIDIEFGFPVQEGDKLPTPDRFE